MPDRAAAANAKRPFLGDAVEVVAGLLGRCWRRLVEEE
jgi:hypothetical protein